MNHDCIDPKLIGKVSDLRNGYVGPRWLRSLMFKTCHVRLRMELLSQQLRAITFERDFRNAMRRLSKYEPISPILFE